MAKLIASQVKEGGGKDYHEQILETHMIVIGKNNLFAGDTAIKDQTLFELDVYPTIKQTQEPIPQNKMFWKFFELQKFTESPGFAHINQTSSLKEQWPSVLGGMQQATRGAKQK